jgi:hypothetical protein
MQLVLAAAVAELRELKTLGRRLLVLRRRVIPLLALSALQCHNFTHFNFPTLSFRCQISDSRDHFFSGSLGCAGYAATSPGP